jgi:acetoin utilization deacetylase AcuC-like enzyme
LLPFFVIKRPMDRISVLYSDQFLTDYSTVSCENPERVSSIRARIDDISQFIEPEPCSIDDLLLCHTERLVKLIEKKESAYPTAMKATGGAIRAAEIALERPSFALIRPPGHHAGRDFYGGFCFFNNTAVAVRKLLAQGMITSALIVDIDLHYGNGTWDIVRDDPRVSFHNIEAFRRPDFFTDLEGALEKASSFDILVCSAGFDTYVKDWGMLLLTEDYKTIGSMLVSANRRLVAILEGGYYTLELGRNVRSFLRGIVEGAAG